MRAGRVSCCSLPAVFCSNLCQALLQGAFHVLGLRTSNHTVQVIAAGLGNLGGGWGEGAYAGL